MKILTDDFYDIPNLLIDRVSRNRFITALNMRYAFGRTTIPWPPHFGAMINCRGDSAVIASALIAFQNTGKLINIIPESNHTIGAVTFKKHSGLIKIPLCNYRLVR